MPPSTTSVVPIGPKVCQPFVLEIMVFSPESGYKFKVLVERSCTPAADAIWKLVFDLFQTTNGSEVQLVHVSFTAGTPVEQTAVQQMTTQGVTPAQANVLVQQVYPAAKAVVGSTAPTPEQKQAVHQAMASVVNLDV